jgi:hypothetical protein
MNRPRRLQSAEHWLKSIRYARPAGRRLVRRYAKWYGVDRLCALIELELLEVPIDPAYAERLREAFARPRPKKKRKERKEKGLPQARGPRRPMEVEPVALWEMGIAMEMFDYAVAAAEEEGEKVGDLHWWDFL